VGRRVDDEMRMKTSGNQTASDVGKGSREVALVFTRNASSRGFKLSRKRHLALEQRSSVFLAAQR
jgi:hypothetical protein